MVKWKEKRLGEIADIKTGPFGSVLHAYDYVNVGTPIITVEHLGDYSITRQNLPLVSDIDKYRLSAYTLNKGDIVFSRVGSVDRNAYVTENENDWLFSGRLLRIRIIDNDIVDARYLSYYFKFETTKKRICSVAVGQTMASLNTKIMNDFIVEYPPLPEQRRIAEVLSDTDELIATLEKLIAKKRAIKQGAMQELLTGKRRLSGFSGEWVNIVLEQISDIFKGKGLSKSKVSVNGRYFCILYGELFTEYTEIINSIVSKTEYEDGVLSKKGDILIPGSTTTTGIDLARASAIPFDEVLIGGDVNIIRPRSKEVDSMFLAFYITNMRQQEIAIRAKGITVYHLHGKDLLDLPLHIPQEKAEQTAIASILSDMDVEIDMLSARLNKLRNIKQGMMSELLTGRIRLPLEDNPK